MGPGVKIRCKITLGHPQKLAKRREKVDSGTFPDLNHFLRRVKSSELFLRHPSTSVDVVEGLEGDVGRYFAIKRSWDVPFRALKDARWPILHVSRPFSTSVRPYELKLDSVWAGYLSGCCGEVVLVGGVIFGHKTVLRHPVPGS